MSTLHFTVPPLPHYLMCGLVISPEGDRHPRRSRLGVFDLLVVTRGCLFIGEENRHYEVTPGKALILRPDALHYSVQPNREETHYYWLHFTTTGQWRAGVHDDGTPCAETPDAASAVLRSMQVLPFEICVPQYGELHRPERAIGILDELLAHEREADQYGGSWKQQTLFQELLQHIAGSSRDSLAPTPSRACAERAAAYLRQHSRDEVTAGELGASLNFHPGYIARCMHKELGCSPFEYLQRYRIEQAKLLLLQTNLSIAHIAGEVGFNQAAYFTSCFVKYEGITPRDYRKRFWNGHESGLHWK